MLLLLVALWIILGVAALVGLYFLVRCIMGIVTDNTFIANWIILGLAVAAVIGSAFGIRALSAESTTDDPPPEVTEPASPEVFPQISLTDLELAQMFGHLSRVLDDSSFPIRAQERAAASKALMLELGYKEGKTPEESPFFTDGSHFPLFTAEQINTLLDPETSAEDREIIYREARETFYQRIVSNPIYADMVLQSLLKYDYIVESNPWLLEFKEKIDASLDRDNGGIGWLAWLTPTNQSKTEFVTNDEFFHYAGRVCAVYEYFSIEGIIKRESTVNWGLPPSVDADYLRTLERTKQESFEALALVHRQKSGEIKVFQGINVLSSDMENFTPKEPDPEPDPTPSPTVEPTSPPTSTPAPTHTPSPTPEPTPVPRYTLIINYVDDKNVAVAKQFKETHDKDWEYNISSPVIDGYEADKKVVSGVLTEDTTVTVKYSPIMAPLVIYYEYKDGSQAAPTYTKDYRVGEDYAVPSPVISGYTATMDLVQGQMTKAGRVAHVVYTTDGQNDKDPDADPGNQGNAPELGGSNKGNDGAGDPQPTQPAQHDRTPNGGNNGGGNGGNKGNGGNQNRDPDPVDTNPDNSAPPVDVVDPDGTESNTGREPPNQGSVPHP